MSSLLECSALPDGCAVPRKYLPISLRSNSLKGSRTRVTAGTIFTVHTLRQHNQQQTHTNDHWTTVDLLISSNISMWWSNECYRRFFLLACRWDRSNVVSVRVKIRVSMAANFPIDDFTRMTRKNSNRCRSNTGNSQSSSFNDQLRINSFLFLCSIQR